MLPICSPVACSPSRRSCSAWLRLKRSIKKTVSNFQVILLLMFMVAGIYFMRDMLLFVFTKISAQGEIENHPVIFILFCRRISLCVSRRTDGNSSTDYDFGWLLLGFHKVASGKTNCRRGHDHSTDDNSLATSVKLSINSAPFCAA